MGCFLRVDNPEGIIIERGARIAQVRVHQSSEVENPYNGQYQNDKQRTS
jgi:deoxycytidine triphosphate deaminase